jgi:hypothetical protein
MSPAGMTATVSRMPLNYQSRQVNNRGISALSLVLILKRLRKKGQLKVEIPAKNGKYF